MVRLKLFEEFTIKKNSKGEVTEVTLEEKPISYNMSDYVLVQG